MKTRIFALALLALTLSPFAQGKTHTFHMKSTIERARLTFEKSEGAPDSVTFTLTESYTRTKTQGLQKKTVTEESTDVIGRDINGHARIKVIYAGGKEVMVFEDVAVDHTIEDIHLKYAFTTGYVAQIKSGQWEDYVKGNGQLVLAVEQGQIRLAINNNLAAFEQVAKTLLEDQLPATVTVRASAASLPKKIDIVLGGNQLKYAFDGLTIKGAVSVDLDQ